VKDYPIKARLNEGLIEKYDLDFLELEK